MKTLLSLLIPLLLAVAPARADFQLLQAADNEGPIFRVDPVSGFVHWLPAPTAGEDPKSRGTILRWQEIRERKKVEGSNYLFRLMRKGGQLRIIRMNTASGRTWWSAADFEFWELVQDR